MVRVHYSGLSLILCARRPHKASWLQAGPWVPALSRDCPTHSVAAPLLTRPCLRQGCNAPPFPSSAPPSCHSCHWGGYMVLVDASPLLGSGCASCLVMGGASRQAGSPLWPHWWGCGGENRSWSLTPHLPSVWCCGDCLAGVSGLLGALVQGVSALAWGLLAASGDGLAGPAIVGDPPLGS